MQQSDLRALVARMQQHVQRAASPSATDSDRHDLTSAWDALVAQLALGPEPETRQCPACQRKIMRAATLCGYCWTRLGSEAPHA